MTQRALADELEFGDSTIAMYESGKREPNYEKLEVIADYFNVDMNYLLGKSNIRNSYYKQDKLTEIPMDKIVFDDYFPLHYCTNLSAGSFDEILEAEPDAVVYVPIKFQGRRRKLLAFQVNGTSMNNVIEDHSIVVVENTSTDGINYKDGTIIVAYCDGLVTVKRIYKQPDGNISLVPDSTDKTHLPIMINPEEHPITIIGKVLWHMNPDDIAEKKY
jgi:repressor LexA